MELHPDDADVQHQALKALKNFFTHEENNRKKFMEKGGVYLIQRAINKHPKVSTVANDALTLLRDTYNTSRVVGNFVTADSSVDFIQSGMILHLDNEDVQNKALIALNNLFPDNLSNQKTFMMKDGIDLILKTRKAHQGLRNNADMALINCSTYIEDLNQLLEQLPDYDVRNLMNDNFNVCLKKVLKNPYLLSLFRRFIQYKEQIARSEQATALTMSNLVICVAVDDLHPCDINDVFKYAKAIQEEFIIKDSEGVKAEAKAEAKADVKDDVNAELCSALEIKKDCDDKVKINACVKLFIKAQLQVFTRMEADVLQEWSTAADKSSMNSF